MISRIRRFWLVLLSALAAIILVLAPTSIATAATSGLPLWYQKFQAYVDQYNSNENTVKLDKYQKLIYENPEYIQALESGQAASAPEGTGIIEALENGYSDFYVTGSDGVTHNVKTIQALEDIVSNANGKYADFAAEAKNAGITVRQLEALKATRLTSTSSQLSQAAKTTGVTASELISSSSISTSTALTPVDAVDLPTALSTLKDVDGKVVDTTGTVISEKLIDKGVVKSALKFLGKVGDVGFAWQLATMAGLSIYVCNWL